MHAVDGLYLFAIPDSISVSSQKRAVSREPLDVPVEVVQLEEASSIEVISTAHYKSPISCIPYPITHM